jgi:murein DD-endopeptidase MepM/ murein hydrolase activator NlpD
MKLKLPIYKYNKNSFTYERIVVKTKKILLFLLFQTLFSTILIIFLSLFFNTPKEIKLKNEIKSFEYEHHLIDRKIIEINFLLENIEQKDSVIYQSLFETKENKNKFQSGYIKTMDFDTVPTNLDSIGERLSIIQNALEKSNYRFRKLIVELENNDHKLKHIPAIQPISNSDLKRTSSGFGMRYHPIYKVKKMHYGMDFVAKTGTPIFATGDGNVIVASNSYFGYGKCVKIDHGYGYQTLYAHLNEVFVTKNQDIKRGGVIGTLGNSGLSTGPHLHYEVIYKGKHVDPINYYYHDLTVEQYVEMIRISNQNNKSLD